MDYNLEYSFTEKEVENFFEQFIDAVDNQDNATIYSFLGTTIFHSHFCNTMHSYFDNKNHKIFQKKFYDWLELDIEHIYAAYTLLPWPLPLIKRMFWKTQPLKKIEQYKNDYPERFHDDQSSSYIFEISDILRASSDNPDKKVSYYLLKETYFLSSMKEIFIPENGVLDNFRIVGTFSNLLFLPNDSFSILIDNIFSKIEPSILKEYVLNSISFMVDYGFLLEHVDDSRYQNLLQLQSTLNKEFPQNTKEEEINKLFIQHITQKVREYIFGPKNDQFDCWVNFLKEAGTMYLQKDYQNEAILRSYNFPTEILDKLLPYYQLSQTVKNNHQRISNKNKI